jgi:trehalose 6-phosphate synthase/phosphatase
MNIRDMAVAYKNASKRLLLLDYDGVLVPIMPTPEQAAPTEATYDLLRRLTSDKRNVCVIISGRPRVDLERWFGDLPLSLAAEHGLWRKEQSGNWVFAVDVATDWKQPIRTLMDRYEGQLTGSFIEEKYAGLAFHYRGSQDAEASVRELTAQLQPLLADLSLKLIHGKKVVEVVPAGIDKGMAAQFWLAADAWDFIAGAGDDTTDEALFKILPPQAFSIKVGDGTTTARLKVPSQAAFVELLLDMS